MLVGVAELQMSRRELRVQSGYSHECKDVIQQFQLDLPGSEDTEDCGL